MKNSIYLMIADRAQARIFSTNSKMDVLDLVSDHTNPNGGRIRSERKSDRPRSTDYSTGQLNGAGNEFSAERRNADHFARHLCQLLNRDLQNKKFTELMIAAPPDFLEELRQLLNSSCRQALSIAIDKDPQHLSGSDIGAYFKAEEAALQAVKGKG